MDDRTVCEVTVTLKDDERKYIEKFLIYDSFSVNQDDPIIKACINNAKAQFKSIPSEIKIKINLEVVE